jgi:hypothetical protein
MELTISLLLKKIKNHSSIYCCAERNLKFSVNPRQFTELCTLLAWVNLTHYILNTFQQERKEEAVQ